MASAAPAAAAAQSSAAPAGAGAASPPAPGVATGGGEAHFDPQADAREMFESAPFEHPDVDDTQAEGERLAAEALAEARGEPAPPVEGEDPAPVVEEGAEGAEPFKIVDGLEFESPEAAAEAFRRESGRARANAEAGNAWKGAAGQLAEALRALGHDPRAILAGQDLPAALRPTPAAVPGQPAAAAAAAEGAEAEDGPFDFVKAAQGVYNADYFKATTEGLMKAISSTDDAGAREAIADTLGKMAETQLALTRRALDAQRQEFEKRLEPFEQRDREAREADEHVEAHKGLIKQVATATDEAGALLFPDLFVMTPKGPNFKDRAAADKVRRINAELHDLADGNPEKITVRNWAKCYAMVSHLEQLDGGDGAARGATVQPHRRTGAGGDPTTSATGSVTLAAPRRGNGDDRDGMPTKAPRSVMGVRRPG